MDDKLYFDFGSLYACATPNAGTIKGRERPADEAVNQEYLSSTLRYEDGRLMDAEGEAVMMGWYVSHARKILAACLFDQQSCTGVQLHPGWCLLLTTRTAPTNSLMQGGPADGEACRDHLPQCERAAIQPCPGVWQAGNQSATAPHLLAVNDLRPSSSAAVEANSLIAILLLDPRLQFSDTCMGCL